VQGYFNVQADSIWQKKDYKVFPPSMDWDTVDFDSMPAMQVIDMLLFD
jgi:hypothetical protein